MTKTIRISDDTYSKLCKLGKFGDTMDTILQKLLSKLDTHHNPSKLHKQNNKPKNST